MIVNTDTDLTTEGGPARNLGAIAAAPHTHTGIRVLFQ